MLGVAFVAGSFIFTDALGGTFNGIIEGTTADVAVLPEGGGDFDRRRRGLAHDPRLGGRRPGRPAGGGEAQTAPTRSRASTSSGPTASWSAATARPGFAFNYTETRAITGDQIITLTDGELPTAESEVALDEGTADKAGYDIGDEVELVTPGPEPTRTATLTGLVEFGSEGGLAGATITIFDEQAIQDLFFDGKDVYTSISLTAADGVSQQQLADAASDGAARGHRGTSRRRPRRGEHRRARRRPSASSTRSCWSSRRSRWWWARS